MSEGVDLQDILNDMLQSTKVHGNSRVDTASKLIAMFKSEVRIYTEEQLFLFDEVFETLLQGIEAASMEILSQRLSVTKQAPPKTLARFALDEAAAIAGPVLQHHPKVTEEILVEVAVTRSEDHLVFLSQREALPAAATMPIVMRGSQKILSHLIDNESAELGMSAMEALVERSSKIDALAEKLAARENLPHSVLSRLIQLASNAVKQKFKQKFPAAAGQVDEVVEAVSGSVERKVLEQNYDFHSARLRLMDIKFGHHVSEREIIQLINRKDVECLIVACAEKANLPVEMIVKFLNNSDDLLSVALCSVLGLKFETALSFMALRAEHLGFKINKEHITALIEKLEPQLAWSIIDAKRYVNTIKKN